MLLFQFKLFSHLYPDPAIIRQDEPSARFRFTRRLEFGLTFRLPGELVQPIGRDRCDLPGDMGSTLQRGNRGGTQPQPIDSSDPRTLFIKELQIDHTGIVIDGLGTGGLHPNRILRCRPTMQCRYPNR